MGWSAQKVNNMLHMLQVVRTLVSPSSPSNVTAACQKVAKSGQILDKIQKFCFTKAIHISPLLEKLCSILMAAGIPADILTETINAISEAIRGWEKVHVNCLNCSFTMDENEWYIDFVFRL